ncbi:hypothetical protein ABZ348_32500 [Streptomyces sp. NPDC005963]|uniref:hypothetical protein n=1 Tax=Streptomyces sp. NPDC005963 TaxID=3156721 RepID=UPI0033DD3C2D
MHRIWVGATINAVAVAVLGWGAAGAVELGCEPSQPNECGVPEGGHGYFAAVMISGLVLCGGFLWKAYTRDWRNVLGLTIGAPFGIVAALANGTSKGSVILSLGLFVAGTFFPWVAWRRHVGLRRRAEQNV